MKKTLAVPILAGALAGLSLTSGGSAAAAPAGSYIVVLADGAASAATVQGHARAAGVAPTHVYSHALHGYSAVLTEAAVKRLAADPGVASVSPDRAVSIDAQTLPTGINRVDAELSPTARINGVDERVNVDVAVLDTGVDLDHPDLNVFTAGARNCSTGRSADDGNGHGSQSPARSARSTTATASWESPRAPASGRCACSTTRAPVPSPASSAGSTT